MSLNNETGKIFKKARQFYREYTKGMTPKRISREIQNDSHRLLNLYYDAVGVENEKKAKHQTSVQIYRLFSSLLSRLTPARRLAFGFALAGLTIHFITAGPLAALMLPLSIVILVLLLMLELLEKTDAIKEIDLAKDIQISLLPGSNILHENLEFASFASTANEVGGDYVDVIYSPRGIYYIIADVAGKGLSAALYMVRLQALVHLLIDKLTPGPKDLFLHLNDFIKSNRKDKTFVTACVAFFPFDGSPVKMCRAGHTPPLIYQSSKNTISELRSDGLALGITRSPLFGTNLREMSIEMKPGDNILFYTDGLIEARNEYNEQYEAYRLRQLFELYGSLQAKSILNKIQVAIEEFIQKEKIMDDITFTCIHMHPNGNNVQKNE